MGLFNMTMILGLPITAPKNGWKKKWVFLSSQVTAQIKTEMLWRYVKWAVHARNPSKIAQLKDSLQRILD